MEAPPEPTRPDFDRGLSGAGVVEVEGAQSTEFSVSPTVRKAAPVLVDICVSGLNLTLWLGIMLMVTRGTLRIVEHCLAYVMELMS